MDQNIADAQPPEATLEPKTLAELAARLETLVCSPAASDEHVAGVCREAASHGIACVFVRPDDLDLAAPQLRGAGVAAGSICGYPYGWSTTGVKLYEIRDMLRRGATEIAAVAPLGRLISRQFQSVETEVLQMARSCHEQGAKFRLVLDALALPDDLKIIGIKIAKRCEADFVQMALEAAAGLWAQIPLYRRVLKWHCGLAVPAPDEALDSVLKLYALDVGRILAARPGAILAEWKARQDALAGESPAS